MAANPITRQSERIEAYRMSVRRHQRNAKIAEAMLAVLKDIRAGKLNTPHMTPELLKSNLRSVLWSVRVERRFARRDKAEIENLITWQAWNSKKARLKRKHKQNFDECVHWLVDNPPAGQNAIAACGYPCVSLEDESTEIGQEWKDAELCKECLELSGGSF